MRDDQSRILHEAVETGHETTRRSQWKLLLKLVISIAVLALLSAIVDWQEFARTVAGARPAVLSLAAATLVLGNLCIALRWKLLLETVGVHTSFFQALKSYLKGHFVGFFVPSGATADVVKAVDMNHSRVHGTGSRGYELASSIFVERAFGALTVAMAVALGLTISPLVGEHADMQHVMTLSAAAVLGCCTVALFADKFLSLVPQSVIRRWPRIGTGVSRVRTSFAAYRSAPGRLLLVMLLSIAIQALRVIPVYVIAVAIGAGDRFFPFLIAVPVIFLVNMVPVIGSRLGTEQGLFVLLLGLADISAETALVISLVSLTLGILIALPGGYWLLNPSRSPRTAGPPIVSRHGMTSIKTKG